MLWALCCCRAVAWGPGPLLCLGAHGPGFGPGSTTFQLDEATAGFHVVYKMRWRIR